MITGIERRIAVDLAQIENEGDIAGIRFEPDENDIRHLTVFIDGPVSTPYEGGVFKVDIDLPDGFPYHPPLVRFITKIWHPNISSQNGGVRVDILKEWVASTPIRDIPIALQALLAIPDPSDPIDDLVADQFLNDHKRFDCIAHTWTQDFAMEEMNPPPQPSTRARASGRRRVARNPRHLNNYVL